MARLLTTGLALLALLACGPSKDPGPLPQAAAPTISPAAGSYQAAQSVILTTTTPAATIRYTTDGAAPSATSLVYQGPIDVQESTTIKAYALATGFADSPVATASYVIEVPLARVQGTWQVAETVTGSTCGAAAPPGYVLVIQQSETALAVKVGGAVLPGVIGGNQASWSGEYPDAWSGGFRTLTAASATFSGTTLAGVLSWERRATQGGGATCSGTSSITGHLVSPPARPTNLEAVALTSARIQVTWVDASADEDGFILWRGQTADAVTDRVATLPAGAESYPDDGLAASTTYYYAVQAYNVAGASVSSVQASATTPPPSPLPAAPTDLAVVQLRSTAAVLAWQDPTPGDHDGFMVRRAASARGEFALIRTLGPDARTFTSGGLLPGHAYTWTVTAFNASGASAPSAPVTATTPDDVTDTSWTLALNGFTATGCTAPAGRVYQNVDVSLTATTVRVDTGYGILTGTQSGLQLALTGTLRFGTTSVAVNAPNLTISADRSRISGTAGWSAGSGCHGTANFVMTRDLPAGSVPTAPTALQATLSGDRTIHLAWTDNSGTEQGFNVLRQGPVDGSLIAIAQVDANVVAYDDAAVAPGGAYTYAVEAFNAAGESAPTNQVTVLVPAVPVLSGPVTAGPAFTLTWTFDWPCGSPCLANSNDRYDLEGSTTSGSAGFGLLVAVPGGSARSQSVSGQAPGAHWYRIRACPGGTCGGPSDPVSVTVQAAPPVPAPESLTAQPSSSTAIALSWRATCVDGQFLVERALAPPGAFQQVGQVTCTPTVGTVTVTWSDGGLSPATAYAYRVRARRASGATSAYSNVATATTFGGGGDACGGCPAHSSCQGGTCICANGYVPDPGRATCIAVGGPCGAVSSFGYCVDSSLWAWCDPIHGVVTARCDLVFGTECYLAQPGSPTGSCDCGALDSAAGICGGVSGGPAGELWFYCLDVFTLVGVENCRDRAGSSGHCGVLITEFGYQGGCFP